jgi:manganese oxidase
MADMGEMGMPVPRNSIPMVGAQGKHDYIDMGGLFTIVKVRENLTSYDDPGWYENPPGTLASLASNDELQRDLGKIPEANPMDNNMKMDHGNMDHMDMKHGG